MREAARDGLPALVGLAAIALVCGMLQAAGPGHGKIVIASAFVSADIGWKAATGIAAALSTLQVVSAAAAVVLIGPLIAAGRPGAIRAAAVIELASYAAALPIAAGGSLSALLPPRRSTGPGRSRRGVPPITSALLLAVSMIPSAGAVTLALIAVAHGTLLAGAVAALAMAAGAAMTLAIVAIAGVGARIALVRMLRVGSADLRARVVEALGWLVATIACAAFVWSAWIRLR
jgi:ABC-type nickel/cobalt efflux system permease component RcnA